MKGGVCWFGRGGGGGLDGLSGILGWGCGLVMVRVGEGCVEGLWGEIREASQGEARDGKMVVVELAPVAKACEVDREMD